MGEARGLPVVRPLSTGRSRGPRRCLCPTESGRVCLNRGRERALYRVCDSLFSGHYVQFRASSPHGQAATSRRTRICSNTLRHLTLNQEPALSLCTGLANCPAGPA